MILQMQRGLTAESNEVQQLCMYLLSRGFQVNLVSVENSPDFCVEIHVLDRVDDELIHTLKAHPGVAHSTKTHERLRAIARRDVGCSTGFRYNGLVFDQDSFHIFAGLCAVDSAQNVEAVFKKLKALNITTTRAGAYKPRTSPYDFQGRGDGCLPYVFELAGKYGISVIAMEVAHESHIEAIERTLEQTGNPTGVILQVGTRNAQNFHLLQSLGRQKKFPVLYKRGKGLPLNEALNACEYIAHAGNPAIMFTLRGVQTNLAWPHRNFPDTAQIPVVKRWTRLSVCFDPSHSVGNLERDPDGFFDLSHVAAQAVIAGTNALLVDVHPSPAHALCDGGQALTLDELEKFIEDMQTVRKVYGARKTLQHEQG